MCVYICVVWFVSIGFVVCEQGSCVRGMGNEYCFSNTNATWYASSEACVSMNAKLASIGDSQEQTFLSQKMDELKGEDRRGFWIGLSTLEGSSICQNNSSPLECFPENSNECCRVRRQWNWTDGTDMTFMRWMINEPSGAHKCGRIVHSNTTERPHNANFTDGYYWFEVHCKSEFRFICEQTIATSSPTASSAVLKTHSEGTSNNPSNTTAVAAGMAVAACLLLAAAILAVVYLIHRRRREKQALAKTLVTIVPVDAPHTQATLEHDTNTDERVYINNNAPHSSNDKGTYYSKNNTAKADRPLEPVSQTMYADIQFSTTQRQPEPPKRDLQAAQTLSMRQVEYADLSFATPGNKPLYAGHQTEEGYAGLNKPQSVMQYANTYDVTAVYTPLSTDTSVNIPKPARPKLAVKPQPQNSVSLKKQPNHRLI